MAKRLRVQARQIYVYSHAGLLDLDAKGRDRAAAGLAFMMDHYWHDDGGWIFSCDRSGAPLNRDRDLYEQAFALFALAWVHKATGKTEPLDWVARTVDFLDSQKSDKAHGGYWDETPGSLPRCQNPHMHLLEAWLALFAATGEPEWLARAEKIVGLCEERFFDSQTDTLGEYFTADWVPAPGTEGQIVEPGHHFEWAWLLRRFADATGRDMGELAGRLHAFASAHGIDEDGLVFDAVLRDGTVHDGKKRLWAQTEALKSEVAHYAANGGQAAARRAELLLGRLFEFYLDEGRGDFEDHLTREGRGFKDFAPATSLYHVFLAFTEVMRVFGADR